MTFPWKWGEHEITIHSESRKDAAHAKVSFINFFIDALSSVFSLRSSSSERWKDRVHSKSVILRLLVIFCQDDTHKTHTIRENMMKCGASRRERDLRASSSIFVSDL